MNAQDKKYNSRVYDIGVDLGQGLDLDCTEPAMRVIKFCQSKSLQSGDKSLVNTLRHYLSLELTINW